jgi:lactoylglutathione lyase
MRFYLTISLAIIGFSATLSAQEGPSLNFIFDHIALSVTDVDKSANFYSDLLNLGEITNRTAMDGIRWFSLGEGKELHLISILDQEVKTSKAVHFALSTANFDRIIDELKKRNIEYSDWPGNVNKVNIRADGISQIFFQDPDGYWIEINSTKK